MTAVATRQVTYMVTTTDSGQWLHAPGTDFLFAYIEDSWSQTLKDSVSQAFVSALQMSNVIKKAVLDTSGQEVENGLYLLDQTAMTTAMNSIQGMGETSVAQNEESGEGTAASINAQFFGVILAGLSGDVAPILGYLNDEMAKIQVQTKKSKVTSEFGTIIGLISVMPVLNVVVTTFQYAYSSSETADWFTHVTCGSVEHYSYDYKFTVVNYNYDPTS
ncbi:hypothetical protein [Actinophytocola sp. NPDC049390]|uniref:hypothetical protein n=1 Tax=Actinophytocola sp. NPDC049390 TaxID=3363894 RepID=UPI00379AE654